MLLHYNIYYIARVHTEQWSTYFLNWVLLQSATKVRPKFIVFLQDPLRYVI